MTEHENVPSLEERIAACPIHQWADIKDYLQKTKVPEYLWEPFHLLVIARGDCPKYMSNEQRREFGRKAVNVTRRYEMLPFENEEIKTIFEQLIIQWICHGAENN